MAGNGSGVQSFQIQAGASFGELLAVNNLNDVSNATSSNNNLFINGSLAPTATLNSFVFDSTYLGAHVTLENGGVAFSVQLPSGMESIGFITLWNSESSVGGTVSPSSGSINDGDSITIGAKQSITLYSDGTNYYTMASGGDAVTVPTFTTNVATLTSANYNTTCVLINSDTAGTVNFPAATSPVIIKIASANVGLMTLTPAMGETISGQSTLVLGSNDVVELIGSIGSGWIILNSWLQPVNCYVTSAGTQNLPANVATTVGFDTESFDIGSFFNTSTHVYTPLLPGKYMISTTAGLDSTGAGGTTTFSIFIYKNSTLINGSKAENIIIATTSILSSNIYIDMNGSTDSITIKVSQDSLTDPDLTLTSGCNFSAVRMGLF